MYTYDFMEIDVCQSAASESGTSFKPSHIEAFDFLRVIGMLMIFINHCWGILPFHIPDLGARGVELFSYSQDYYSLIIIMNMISHVRL